MRFCQHARTAVVFGTFFLLPGALAYGQRSEGSTSDVGYIDSAIPATRFRLRFDAAYDDNRPERAEFFYPKCRCFRDADAAPFQDPRAPGPPLAETRVDYQDISSYLEWAPTSWLSGFVELPLRFLNPELNANATGLADMNAGFKVALLQDCHRTFSFQLRTYIPTGNSERGLGTHHVSLEPALLCFQQLTDRWKLESEFRDWIPIGGTDFSGNVTRYGIGVSYLAYDNSRWRLAPVVEVVGWTVLNGKETVPPIPEGTSFVGHVRSASGDTIVNVKFGARLGLGDHNDFYIGYGRALTGDVWYKDILRLEYRLFF